VRKYWKLLAVTGVTAIVGGIAAIPAGAAPPSGYGFDDTAHIVVGGGSDTTYRAQTGLTDLWNLSGLSGCQHSTGANANQNNCQADIATNLGNYQGDTFAQANPVGSGGGINSLNGNNSASNTYHGTANPIANPSRVDTVGTSNGSPTVTDTTIGAGDLGESVSGAGIPKASYVGTVTPGASFVLSSAPNVQMTVNATATATVSATIATYDCVTATTGPNADFARSSRAPNTPTGGSAPCGDELRADTFWGFGQDGVAVIGFNTHGNLLNGLAAPELAPNDLFDIWNCSGGTGTGGRVRWSDIITSISPGSANDADIVPWQMNTASGTFSTFQNYIKNNASGVPTGWSPNGQACDRKLADGSLPLENDIKPLIKDPATLGTGTSNNNPENWMWWGSFGVFSAFPNTSNFTRGTAWSAKDAAINGITPGTGNILQLTYPISRTLFHVTRKADADCPKTSGVCDLSGNPGPTLAAGGTDLNVTGGTGGVSGAVREYTRFLCRPGTAQQGVDPFTGLNFDTEITGAINAAGFTTIKNTVKTGGSTQSRCVIVS
jgi:hypothetical protein